MKRRSVAAALILACLASSSCANEPSSGTGAASPEPSPMPSPESTIASPEPSPKAMPVWDQFPEVDRTSGEVAVGEFNAYLESARPPWAISPLRASLEFLAVEEPLALTTSVVMEASPPEGADEALVTVTEDGLADDSVGAIRYVLEFERQADGSWRLLSATWAQRCQSRRGHQDFSTELCV